MKGNDRMRTAEWGNDGTRKQRNEGTILPGPYSKTWLNRGATRVAHGKCFHLTVNIFSFELDSAKCICMVQIVFFSKKFSWLLNTYSWDYLHLSAGIPWSRAPRRPIASFGTSQEWHWSWHTTTAQRARRYQLTYCAPTKSSIYSGFWGLW